MKKIAILLSILLLLTACSDENPEQPGENLGKSTYNHTNFSIQGPQDWKVIERNQLTTNIPEDVIVAFKNNMKSEIFTANLVISIKAIGSVSLEDYTTANIQEAEDNLLNFTVISEEETEVPKGEENIPAKYIVTEGKNQASSPILLFQQVYAIDESRLYTLTAASLSTEDESIVNALQEMLDSFSLK